MPALDAAPLLLGWEMRRNTPEGNIGLIIIETEAYHQDDPASHSYRGVTARTAPMFEAGGRLYIYFTYGMHYCLNIVTGPKGRGEAVLIRAGEPTAGVKIMQKNRNQEDIYRLANGPAKLTQALGINDTKLSGKMLDKSSILLVPPKSNLKPADVVASPRIGIREAVEMPWRFYISGNKYVSKL